MSSTAIEEKTQQVTTIKPPNLYKVVFNNDNTTPMEFVIDVLVHLFHHDQTVALAITEEVHTKGKGIAGVYTYEIADQKSAETISLSRANGYPLVTSLEIA